MADVKLGCLLSELQLLGYLVAVQTSRLDMLVKWSEQIGGGSYDNSGFPGSAEVEVPEAEVTALT